MNGASVSYETTWDNLQVHGTAIAEIEERGGQERKTFQEIIAKIFQKMKIINPKIQEAQELSRRKTTSSKSLPNC